jgi:hypothetical protein
MQQLDLLCYYDPIQEGYSRYVAPRFIEGGNKANLYWIATDSENDWNS